MANMLLPWAPKALPSTQPRSKFVSKSFRARTHENGRSQNGAGRLKEEEPLWPLFTCIAAGLQERRRSNSLGDERGSSHEHIASASVLWKRLCQHHIKVVSSNSSSGGSGSEAAEAPSTSPAKGASVGDTTGFLEGNAAAAPHEEAAASSEAKQGETAATAPAEVPSQPAESQEGRAATGDFPAKKLKWTPMQLHRKRRRVDVAPVFKEAEHDEAAEASLPAPMPQPSQGSTPPSSRWVRATVSSTGSILKVGTDARHWWQDMVPSGDVELPPSDDSVHFSCLERDFTSTLAKHVPPGVVATSIQLLISAQRSRDFRLGPKTFQHFGIPNAVKVNIQALVHQHVDPSSPNPEEPLFNCSVLAWGISIDRDVHLLPNLGIYAQLAWKDFKNPSPAPVMPTAEDKAMAFRNLVLSSFYVLPAHQDLKPRPNQRGIYREIARLLLGQWVTLPKVKGLLDRVFFRTVVAPKSMQRKLHYKQKELHRRRLEAERAARGQLSRGGQRLPPGYPLGHSIPPRPSHNGPMPPPSAHSAFASHQNGPSGPYNAGHQSRGPAAHAGQIPNGVANPNPNPNPNSNSSHQQQTTSTAEPGSCGASASSNMPPPSQGPPAPSLHPLNRGGVIRGELLSEEEVELLLQQLGGPSEEGSESDEDSAMEGEESKTASPEDMDTDVEMEHKAEETGKSGTAGPSFHPHRCKVKAACSKVIFAAKKDLGWWQGLQELLQAMPAIDDGQGWLEFPISYRNIHTMKKVRGCALVPVGQHHSHILRSLLPSSTAGDSFPFFG